MPLPAGLVGPDLQTIVNALQQLTAKLGELIKQVSVSAPPVTGVGEAPNDGPGAPLYARGNLQWSHITHNDIVDWAASLPPGGSPSDATPLMAAGAGTPGTSALYARGDHVHPDYIAVTTSVASPASTTSNTYVMMGIALTIAIAAATQAWVTVDGQIGNSANNGETDLVLCYGTGTPPANGVAQVGTILGSVVRYISTTGAGGGGVAPFAITRLVSGLTPGTTYWFDVALQALSGTGSVSALDITGQGVG